MRANHHRTKSSYYMKMILACMEMWPEVWFSVTFYERQSGQSQRSGGGSRRASCLPTFPAPTHDAAPTALVRRGGLRIFIIICYYHTDDQCVTSLTQCPSVLTHFCLLPGVALFAASGAGARWADIGPAPRKTHSTYTQTTWLTKFKRYLSPHQRSEAL